MQWKVNARDTRFVPEVWPTTKFAYVSVEVLTKSRVSFNPNPPKWRTIQTSQDVTTILGSSRVTLSHLGD
jgi:hypothetical protein